jgi:hypothetical protein
VYTRTPPAAGLAVACGLLARRFLFTPKENAMSIQVAGQSAVVFGTNRAHARSVVKDACEKQGWKNVVNRPPSQSTAIQEAIKEVARMTTVEPELPLLIRNLTADLAFEAVRIRKGATRNDAIHVVSAAVDASHKVQLLELNGQLPAGVIGTHLQQAYDQRRDLMSPGQLRTAVAGVVRRLNGVALGGSNLYYLPADAVSRFAQWRDDAQLWRYHMVPFEVASDPKTVEHIVNQLHEEVTSQSQGILDEITTGIDDEKRVKLLRKKCQAIVSKIRSYEEALGQQLDWMREPLEAAENGLAVSSLLEVSV